MSPSNIGVYGNVRSLAHRLRLHATDARREIDAATTSWRGPDGRIHCAITRKALALGEYADSLESLSYNLELLGVDRK